MSSERAAYAFPQLTGPDPIRAQEADDVIALAHREAAAIREEARARGEREGRAAALEQMRVEATPALLAMTNARDALDDLREEVVTELHADALRIAMSLAEQIVAGAIAVAPERLLDIAAVALRRLSDRRQVTLVVNPADLDLMRDAVDRLQAELGGIEHCNVQADRRVARGGVCARTDAGEIDATIEAQLQRAREIVSDELAQGRETPSAAPAH